ncbi:MarR family transcriptional regulator [uncultured Nocardioides sp.]|uniref:MarR family winged helix-turn-helix transcriptional regulator n=1 Tax=uncultured Nocardioides sp. TaxID=198441 RepID=UPI000C5A66EF|nr:MarR family transcriptional regulator [Nocardioides sp.]|tara:strand:- start:561 stop:1022 length:462 start_codon:yes stop_codon:yes gene_type:complete
MGEEPSDAVSQDLLEEMVCFDLHAASRAMTAVYRPLLDPLGLTYPQYLVLTVLWERGPQPIGAIVQRLEMDYGTISPLVKRLETHGLVRRARSAQDERQVEVALTEDGDRLRHEAPRIRAAITEALGLTARQAEELHRVLRRVTARAREGAAD